jgi:hypothetical protein
LILILKCIDNDIDFHIIYRYLNRTVIFDEYKCYKT